MNDIKRIVFKLASEDRVNIYAVVSESPYKEILIGDMFSKDSYSGKNSVQICGFDDLKGAWSCGRYNHSMDCCLVWNDVKQFLEKKV